MLNTFKAFGAASLMVAGFTSVGFAQSADTALSPAVLAVTKLCDTLAADPEDDARPEGVMGVALEKIDVASATAGCEAALAIAPDEPRMAYNMGRILVASGNYIDGAAQLRAAADDNYAAAFRVIGDMYAKGQGFAVDAKKAEEFYAKAAEAGDTSVALRQVDALLASGVPADRKKGLDLLKAAAEKGNPGAQFRAAIELEGRISDVIFGPEEDLLVAERYLKAAAAAKFPEAERELLRLHLSGKPFDAEAAFADLVAAAEGDDPWAMTELAERLMISDVGPYAKLDATAQFDAANEWLKKAAALDYPDALYQLAGAYSWGAGNLPQDEAESTRLYQRAAEMGHPGAAARYGFKLYRAANTEQEYAEAAHFFTLARDGGVTDGAIGMGHLYLEGLGVPRDITLAIENYEIASREGLSGVADYQLARIYDSQPGYRDPRKAADYLVHATDQIDAPEEEAKAGFKEFSRDTRVALQEELIRRKLLKGTADGAFGPASLAAYLAL